MTSPTFLWERALCDCDLRIDPLIVFPGDELGMDAIPTPPSS